MPIYRVFYLSFCRAARFRSIAEGCPDFSTSRICERFIFQFAHPVPQFFRLLCLFRPGAFACRFQHHLCLCTVPQSLYAYIVRQKLLIWGENASYFPGSALRTFRGFSSPVRVAGYIATASSCANSGHTSYTPDFATFS